MNVRVLEAIFNLLSYVRKVCRLFTLLWERFVETYATNIIHRHELRGSVSGWMHVSPHPHLHTHTVLKLIIVIAAYKLHITIISGGSNHNTVAAGVCMERESTDVRVCGNKLLCIWTHIRKRAHVIVDAVERKMKESLALFANSTPAKVYRLFTKCRMSFLWQFV